VGGGRGEGFQEPYTKAARVGVGGNADAVKSREKGGLICKAHLLKSNARQRPYGQLPYEPKHGGREVAGIKLDLQWKKRGHRGYLLEISRKRKLSVRLGWGVRRI